VDEAEEKRRKVFAGLIWKRLEIDVLWVGYLSCHVYHSVDTIKSS
jgi:hypothetical protein